MDDPDFFTNTQIAIIGLGLMGGSLALGLRKHCHRLLAVDPDPHTCELAMQEKIVDQISANPAEILPQADLIILAAPVSAILEFIPRLPDLHPGNPVVLDLGSTKTQICRALASLPERFEPIGGHPMCGKSVGGLSHAEANFFEDVPFAFTPLARTTERAHETAERIAHILKANPLWIGPNTHDYWVAATSHLPYLLSTAMSLATPAEATHMVGPGFRSTSRLAGSPSSVMLPILETNRDHILDALARFRHQLDDLEESITRGDYATTQIFLDQGAEHRAILTGF